MKAKAKIAVLGFFLGISSAFAYKFTDDFTNGIYWKSFPIAFQKFVNSNAEGKLLNQFVSQAENQWENAVGVDLWNVASGYVVASSYSGNFIRWSNNFAAETGYSPITTLAVTVRHRAGTYFERVEIILNGENSSLRSNQGNMLFQTVLHEMGHTLGIAHSTYPTAVMYPSIQGINSLSSDDQQAVIAIVDQTQKRQETGYVSTLASGSNKNKGALACGSISLVGDSDQGSGPGSGAVTVVLGFLLVLLLSKTRQFLPIRSFR